jgi:hypothetical protein
MNHCYDANTRSLISRYKSRCDQALATTLWHAAIRYRISIGALLLGAQEQCAVLREQFGILVGCSVIGVRIEDELCIGERRNIGQKIGR